MVLNLLVGYDLVILGQFMDNQLSPMFFGVSRHTGRVGCFSRLGSLGGLRKWRLFWLVLAARSTSD